MKWSNGGSEPRLGENYGGCTPNHKESGDVQPFKCPKTQRPREKCAGSCSVNAS
jgi:hypothetical protein